MKLPELLAPAGDLNRLKLAIKYGADAVYLGGQFGLRSGASLKQSDLEEAIFLAHAHEKKIYVTVNIFARNSDFDQMLTYLKYLDKLGVDAVIVSDLGVLRLARENTNLDVHISTQANVLNKYTADEYVKLGAKRIILARECSLAEIEEIAAFVKGSCDIEVFVHGAMCVSYSGRCMISNYMTSHKKVRDGNRGECAQPCRYHYALVEEKRPLEYWPVEEDAQGTYIMNSKELCLVNHLKELADCGVTSFKIEGRMKSEYYVAAVVKAYSLAINGKLRDCLNEVNKIPHRPYTTGFVFQQGDHIFSEHSNQISTFDVVAICFGKTAPGYKVYQRNHFLAGDELEIVSPGKNHNKKVKVKSIKDELGESVTRANKTAAVYFLELESAESNEPVELNPDDFLRKAR